MGPKFFDEFIQYSFIYYILNYQYVGENQEEIVDIKTDKKICGNSIYDLEILSDVLEKQGMI